MTRRLAALVTFVAVLTLVSFVAGCVAGQALSRLIDRAHVEAPVPRVEDDPGPRLGVDVPFPPPAEVDFGVYDL